MLFHPTYSIVEEEEEQKRTAGYGEGEGAEKGFIRTSSAARCRNEILLDYRFDRYPRTAGNK